MKNPVLFSVIGLMFACQEYEIKETNNGLNDLSDDGAQIFKSRQASSTFLTLMPQVVHKLKKLLLYPMLAMWICTLKTCMLMMTRVLSV